MRVIDFLLFGTEVSVCHVGQYDEDGEVDEGKDGFPEFHVIWRDDHEDDDQPDISEDAEEGGDTEHLDVVDAADVRAVDGEDTHRGYHQQVEGGRTHNSTGPELPRAERVTNDLNAGQQDLRGTGTQGHESQIGHSVIPYFDLHFDVTCFRFRTGHFDFTCLAGDFLNSTHEDISNDRHAEEAPQKPSQVQEGTHSFWPCVLVNDGQNEPLLRTQVCIDVARLVRHLDVQFRSTSDDSGRNNLPGPGPGGCRLTFLRLHPLVSLATPAG